jgi:ferredoxin
VAKPNEGNKGAAEELKELQRALAYDDTFNCIQCGYCLPVCPTYETMGTETHSPRGRINLVKMTAEGKLTNWTLLADSIDNCLGCRACETACPTGVKYGHIFESAKEAIAAQRPRQGRPEYVVPWFVSEQTADEFTGWIVMGVPEDRVRIDGEQAEADKGSTQVYGSIRQAAAPADEPILAPAQAECVSSATREAAVPRRFLYGLHYGCPV